MLVPEVLAGPHPDAGLDFLTEEDIAERERKIDSLDTTELAPFF